MLTGDGDWAGGIVGLERNPDVVKDLTSLCEYMLEVLKTMPESDYRSSVEKRTNFKLKVRYFRNFSYIGLKPVSGVAIWSLGGGDD